MGMSQGLDEAEISPMEHGVAAVAVPGWSTVVLSALPPFTLYQRASARKEGLTGIQSYSFAQTNS